MNPQLSRSHHTGRPRQRLYASLLALGASILLFRTIAMVAKGSMTVLMPWVSSLLVAESVLDVTTLLASVRCWMAGAERYPRTSAGCLGRHPARGSGAHFRPRTYWSVDRLRCAAGTSGPARRTLDVGRSVFRGGTLGARCCRRFDQLDVSTSAAAAARRGLRRMNHVFRKAHEVTALTWARFGQRNGKPCC